MATIGEILRRERARKGLTLQEIEQSLHIRAAYLEAVSYTHLTLPTTERV